MLFLFKVRACRETKRQFVGKLEGYLCHFEVPVSNQLWLDPNLTPPLVDLMHTWQQGLTGEAEAVPTCPAGIEDCAETSGTEIIPRRVPLAPSVDVPLSIGTTNSPNSFTSTSLMVTFAADTADVPSTTCAATMVTKFKVEWDTNPSFNSLGGKPMSYDEVAETSPEVQNIDTDDGSPRFNITELTQGTTYYIRVSALNTLGYGAAADYQDAIPMTSADAPGFPTTIAQLDEVFCNH